MKLLGVDTTGGSMSVAATDGDKLLGEIFVDNGKKHSVTLMPAIDELMCLVDHDINEMDAFAVTVGPGSFTGIRIGVAAVSALAYATGKPVYAVSTLDALLENVSGFAVSCAMMDARRDEVYTAAWRGGEPLLKESAIPVKQLLHELMLYDEVVFVGDGALRYREQILAAKPDSAFAGEQFILQRAGSVCMCALRGRATKLAHDGIKPHYLRESQAERMKRLKEIEQ